MSEYLFWLSLYVLFGAYFVKESRAQTKLMSEQLKILMDKDMEILRLIQENGELQRQVFALWEKKNDTSGGPVDPG